MSKDDDILAHTIADRQLVEALYMDRKLSYEERCYALDFLYPCRSWGIWAAHLLLTFGVVLILVGIVYFTAFNWMKISSGVKLIYLQLCVIIPILIVYYTSLESAVGNIALFTASLMVGVFIAAFGQIYQTDSDAYQLFVSWAVLIFGWTVLSNSISQWFLWWAISNIAFCLWWLHWVLPSDDMDSMIFVYLMFINGIILLLHEYLSCDASYRWLRALWVSWMILVFVLFIMVVPILLYILENAQADYAQRWGALFGVLGHVVLYLFYRYIRPNINVLAAVLLSASIICECSLIKVVDKLVNPQIEMMLLWMVLSTLGIFTLAIKLLRTIAPQLERANV